MVDSPYAYKRRSLKPYLAAAFAVMGAVMGAVIWRRGR